MAEQGRSIKYFFLRAEITITTKEGGKSVPQLSDKKWVKVIAFTVGKMAYLKEVNIKLQGNSKLLYDMFSDMKALLQNDVFFEGALAWNRRTNNNNNNNNNYYYYYYYYYYYLLQLGCYLVAVVILHVYKT